MFVFLYYFVFKFAACHDIDQWPSPLPGQLLKLPLMGMVLHVRIPTKQDKPETHAMTSHASVSSQSIHKELKKEMIVICV